MLTKTVDLWGRMLDAVESDDFSAVDTEIDWVIKRKLFNRYLDRYDIDLGDPKIAQLDLAHDIKPGRGVADVLTRKGLISRVTTDEAVEGGGAHRRRRPGPGCAARFISARPGRRARLHRRLGPPPLKLNDQAQRTVLCKDPFPLGRRACRSAHRLDVGGITLVVDAQTRESRATAQPRHLPAVHPTVRLRRVHPRNVGGYYENDSSDDAFYRMFERDKADLRELGIPVITGPTSGFGDRGRLSDRPGALRTARHPPRARQGGGGHAGHRALGQLRVAEIAQARRSKLRAAGIEQ